MHGTTSGNAYANRCDLARTDAVRIDPDTVVTGEPTGLDAEVGEDVEKELFDALDVRRSVSHTAAPFPGHGEDRVPDELTGAVVGDVTAPVGGRNGGPHRLDIDKQVLPWGPLRQRDDVVMLQQKQVVTGVRTQLLLQRERVGVGDSPEPANPQARLRDGKSGQLISASQSRFSMISWIRLRNAAA